MGAKASNVTIAENSFYVEANAMVFAMIFALKMGFTNVEFEGDALAVIRKMQRGEADFSPIGMLLKKLETEYPHSEAVALCMLIVKAIR
ncbi:hypothetical protein CRYUN_Cryun20dG0057600 [Craigia yunnanensis]